MFADFWTMSLIVWVSVLVITLIIEGFSTVYISMWFSVSAVFMLILSLIFYYIFPTINLMWYIQLTIFLVISLVFLFSFRPVFVKRFGQKIEKTNVDSLEGKIGVVTKSISSLERGLVKVNGQEWSAASSQTIDIGESVVVKAIEGVKLIVEKA